MRSSNAPGWRLVGFEEALDRSAETENPSTDLRSLVTEWVLSRFDNPHQGVRREPGSPEGLWFGKVPGSDHGAGAAVACAYWIDEAEKVVRCDNIASLNKPF